MKSIKVPKIIHQIWFQGQENIPQKYLVFQKKWITTHSEFRYMIWDEKTIGKLISKKYPFFFSIWKNLRYMIQKIDSAKIFILHHFGGVLVDMDMEPIGNISSLLNHPLVFSQCYLHKLAVLSARLFGLKSFARTRINNAFIACSPQHPVMTHAIELLQKTALLPKRFFHSVYIAKTCGTEVIVQSLLDILDKQPNLDFEIYDSEYLEPKIGMTTGTPNITKNTRVIHHSEKTWIGKDGWSETTHLAIFILITTIILFVVTTIVTIGIIRRRRNRKHVL